jgi:hypothetical protein
MLFSSLHEGACKGLDMLPVCGNRGVWGLGGRRAEGDHMRVKVNVQEKLKLSLCLTKHDIVDKYWGVEV